MTWLSLNRDQVIDLLGQHVRLAVPAVLISIVLAIILGRIAFRWPRFGTVILGAAGLLYSVPALPLLIVIPVVLSIPLRSENNLIIALSVYGTALLAGTAADAFRSVDTRVREAAEAMGYSPTGIFWRVDLPLSLPVLVSGIRVVTVSTVSLVTIGALVGIGSLGSLLTDGFQRNIREEVATGVIGTMLLAIVLDLLIVAIGAALTPWEQRRTQRRPRHTPTDTTSSATPDVEVAA